MKKMAIVAALLTAASLHPCAAHAAEYFVATNGCDAAEGSAASPWRMIQRAADVAQPGDVVTIRGNRINHNGGWAGIWLDSIDRVPCGSGGHVFINNILAHDPHFPKELFPSRFEDNWMIPAECWKGNETTGECEITPPAGSKRPDFKSVDAKRLGKPNFVDQNFPEPMVRQEW